MSEGLDSANIPIGLNTDPILEELRKLNSAFASAFSGMKKSATETNSKIELIQKGFAALKAVASFVADVITDYAKAAIDAERNERRWLIAMQLRERVTRQQIDAQRAFVDQVSQATAIDDDAILNLQEQLSLMGVRQSRLSDATKATIGLAQVTGSLDSAARLYARTQQGQTEALKRYGIQAKDSQDATRKLMQLYQLATDETKTLGGQVKLLEINFGNFKEELGSAVTKSDVAFEGMKALNDITRDFTEYLGSKEGQDLVDGFFDLLIIGGQVTLTSLEGVVRVLDTLTKRVRANYELATVGFYTEQLDEAGNVVETTLGEFANQIAAAEAKLYEARQRAAEGRSNRSDSVTTPKPGGGGGGRNKEEEKLAKEREAAVREAIEYHEKLNKGEIESERRRTEARNKVLDERDAQRLREINAENEKEAFYKDLHARERDEFKRHNDEMLAMGFGYAEDQQRLGEQLVGAAVDTLTGIVESFLSGEGDARAAAEGFFGAVLKSVGQYLIGLGTANIVGGAWPPNPVQIGAGIAQVALGAALAGGGAYLSGAAGRRQEAARERETFARESDRAREREEKERDRVRRERLGSGGGAFTTRREQPINVVYNLQLQGFGIGSPALFGRMALDGIRQANRLSSGRLSIGG
jgi:hypothetical protein